MKGGKSAQVLKKFGGHSIKTRNLAISTTAPLLPSPDSASSSRLFICMWKLQARFSKKPRAGVARKFYLFLMSILKVGGGYQNPTEVPETPASSGSSA